MYSDDESFLPMRCAPDFAAAAAAAAAASPGATSSAVDEFVCDTDEEEFVFVSNEDLCQSGQLCAQQRRMRTTLHPLPLWELPQRHPMRILSPSMHISDQRV